MATRQIGLRLRIIRLQFCEHRTEQIGKKSEASSSKICIGWREKLASALKSRQLGLELI